MVKKFLLGCAVIFVDPGSDTQLYVAIFIATGFLLLLAVVNPYEKVQDNICAKLSHFSLAAIATFALMIKNEVCEKDGWKCEIVDWSMLFTVPFRSVCFDRTRSERGALPKTIESGFHPIRR